jgi:hypothetical protein
VPSGSGKAGLLSQGSDKAALASLGSGEAEPNFWRSGEVACALLLGLVLGRRCPSSWWAICGHAITSIRLGCISRESQTIISFLRNILLGGQ